MNHELVTSLIERKIIAEHTSIQASVKTTAVGPEVVNIHKELLVQQIVDNTFLCVDDMNKSFVISPAQIDTIDGTTIPRLLKAYRLDTNGKSTQKRKQT
jgi:hypothetical protein